MEDIDVAITVQIPAVADRQQKILEAPLLSFNRNA
jgi:hypothetical protein